jgi:hypothetical protein
VLLQKHSEALMCCCARSTAYWQDSSSSLLATFSVTATPVSYNRARLSQPNMHKSSRSSAGDSQNSPRNTLHTAAAASAIWQSGSPEPPLRTVSPTRLGTKTRDSQSSPGVTGSPRKSVRYSFKSLKHTSNSSLQQLEEEAEVGDMPVRLYGRNVIMLLLPLYPS